MTIKGIFRVQTRSERNSNWSNLEFIQRSFTEETQMTPSSTRSYAILSGNQDRELGHNPLKHCRTLIEAESVASKDTKEAQAHLDQNVLAGYATVALASMLDPSGGLFSDTVRPGQRLFSYFAQTWHSKIAIRDETRK